ncbi:DUF3093 domain-containing protein [Mycobacterium sp.]|uniref:DUF3093 domain-containing protein n=1 Tax=Mycobacterium sp. TaxID=1785 RepID=UPI002B7D08B2|nr:DUF3093 domain-containing protein [Mycobacterium sp.]HME49730.1 DUF3093 domain-containing protein [Mycobacterium sp.]
MSGTRATSQKMLYHERLSVPWWWYPPALFVAGLVALEVNAAARDWPRWISFALLFAVAAGALVWLGRIEVQVVDGTDGPELWAGQAHLPVTVISRSAEVPRSAKSSALGRQLDPAAYVLHRAWIGPMALVVLDDPDDPTPYWLVSSRHPDRVLAALQPRAAG